MSTSLQFTDSKVPWALLGDQPAEASQASRLCRSALWWEIRPICDSLNAGGSGCG